MTSARYDLPGPLESAALRTVGFTTSVSVEEDLTKSTPGGRKVMWYAESACTDARIIVTGRDPGEPVMRQRQRNYGYALEALRIRLEMSAWLENGGHFRPSKHDMESSPHAIIPRSLFDFAAACIAVGLYPRPTPAVHNGNPCPSIMRVSAEEPGLTLEVLHAADDALRRRERPGGIVEPITIAGAAPEEHPFLYARTALYHLAAQAYEEEAAQKNPIGLFKGRGGRTALVSRGLIDTPDATAKDNLGLFLSGQLQ